jgi:hypothetical protein
MKIKRVYHEKVFKGHKLFQKAHSGHLVKGNGYYTLYIHGDFICHAESFKEIKIKAKNEFIKRYGEEK